MVLIRNPKFSVSLYQTTWSTIQLPVNTPLTIKKGMSITKKVRKKCCRSLLLYFNTTRVRGIAKLKFTKVYHLSKLNNIAINKTWVLIRDVLRELGFEFSLDRPRFPKPTWRLITTVSFRLRFQNKNELGLSESEGDLPLEYTRYRIGFDYKIKPLELDLKLFGEVFNEAKSPDVNKGFNRHRYTFKVNPKFKNIGNFGLFYALQDDYSQTIKKSKSIIGFKYTYIIKLKK